MHTMDFFSFCPHCGSANFIISAPNAKKCSDCGFELFKNPAIGVAAFILDKQGRVLVTRRRKNPYAGTLDLPGGFVDLDETVEQALERELQEELNITAQTGRYLFSIPNSYPYKGYDVQPLDFFFEADIINDSQMHRQESEIGEITFIAPQQLNPDDFGSPSIKKAIATYIQKFKA